MSKEIKENKIIDCRYLTKLLTKVNDKMTECGLEEETVAIDFIWEHLVKDNKMCEDCSSNVSFGKLETKLQKKLEKGEISAEGYEISKKILLGNNENSKS